MNYENVEGSINRQVLIRLDTLIRLRWYAIIGQFGAILVIAFGFNYPMPWGLCLVLIALSATLNLLLVKLYKSNHRIYAAGAFNLLAFDLVHLAVLLFLTGGLHNPFTILLLAPVIVSATTLKQNHSLTLGLLAIGLISGLSVFHLPLPWEPNEEFHLPQIYLVGLWGAIVCTLAFTAIYAFRVAEETRKLANALSATELVLQREQHLSALDGLAAAAAHELGTPLATIALVSKEMVHALPSDTPLHEDAVLLRSQAQRCRDILQTLKSLSSQGEPIIEEQSFAAIVEEQIAPLRDFGKEIVVHAEGDLHDMPKFQRNPGIHYGIGNLLDNAVDFATKKVVVMTKWDEGSIRLEISDDGPGFPNSLLDKIGEPFITSRNTKRGNNKKGLGLGLFIAKTLLQRTGAEIVFSNRSKLAEHENGAFVSVVWPREQPVTTAGADHST